VLEVRTLEFDIDRELEVEVGNMHYVLRKVNHALDVLESAHEDEHEMIALKVPAVALLREQCQPRRSALRCLRA